MHLLNFNTYAHGTIQCHVFFISDLKDEKRQSIHRFYSRWLFMTSHLPRVKYWAIDFWKR